MKFIFSISLNCILLFVFTTVTTSSAYACGKSSHCKVAQPKKAQCSKDCCKKSHSESKNKKKGCCGDNCSCSSSILLIADLPKPLSISTSSLQPVAIKERAFFYKQAFPKSTIQDIWQPPITVLSI